jgi:hypothetical protein
VLKQISYTRKYDTKVPAEAAWDLRYCEHLTLRAIKERLQTDADLSTISRSIQRHERSVAPQNSEG